MMYILHTNSIYLIATIEQPPPPLSSIPKESFITSPLNVLPPSVSMYNLKPLTCDMLEPRTF